MELKYRETITVFKRARSGDRYIRFTETYERALAWVREGRAYVNHPYSIVIPMNKKEFHDFIRERDNHTCRYCGNPGDTIDHVIPESEGGLSTPANCVCCCWDCNQQKGNKSLEEFLAEQSQQTVAV